MFHTYHKTLVVVSLIFCSLSSVFAYSGGSGTAGDPYQIATKADLLELAAATADYSQYFVLTADIDMEGQVFTMAIIAADASSSYGLQGTAFTGMFDGNGHKITNFAIDGGSNDYLGLFGYIGSGGSVKNLGLEDCVVSSTDDSWYVGSLVGQNYYGSISDCYSTGAVSSDSQVGGLVGQNSYGSISDCYSMGAVSGVAANNANVGGLVGSNYGSISNCYATGRVSASHSSMALGGLVGVNYGGVSSISNCYAVGNVSGVYFSYRFGGLVGFNSEGGSIGGSISNCYATGTVSASKYVGGLVGATDRGGIISNCYSTGAVGGNSEIGGLVGLNSSSSVSNSFWDTETSGWPTSAGGDGKTTAQMKTLSTFTDAGWDFLGETVNGTEDIWRMCLDSLYYPHLSWEYSLHGDFVCPDEVDFEDLAYFFERWLMTDCGLSNDCDGTDMNTDNAVNFIDFALFAQQWLQCTDPSDSNCD